MFTLFFTLTLFFGLTTLVLIVYSSFSMKCKKSYNFSRKVEKLGVGLFVACVMFFILTVVFAIIEKKNEVQENDVTVVVYDKTYGEKRYQGKLEEKTEDYVKIKTNQGKIEIKY